MTADRVARHTCHHPDCDRPVPPKMLACRDHWYQLPKRLRDAVWAEYVPGQEVRKDPSPEYLDVVFECDRYWRERAAGTLGR